VLGFAASGRSPFDGGPGASAASVLSAGSGPDKPGTVVWTFSTGSQAVDANPTVANGVAYAGGSNDALYAVKAATGQELWTQQRRQPLRDQSLTVAVCPKIEIIPNGSWFLWQTTITFWCVGERRAWRDAAEAIGRIRWRWALG
jgi:PQQ-like domain